MKKRNLLVAAFALCFWPYHQPYYLFPTHWQGLSIYFHSDGTVLWRRLSRRYGRQALRPRAAEPRAGSGCEIVTTISQTC